MVTSYKQFPCFPKTESQARNRCLNSRLRRALFLSFLSKFIGPHAHCAPNAEQTPDLCCKDAAPSETQLNTGIFPESKNCVQTACFVAAADLDLASDALKECFARAFHATRTAWTSSAAWHSKRGHLSRLSKIQEDPCLVICSLGLGTAPAQNVCNFRELAMTRSLSDHMLSQLHSFALFLKDHNITARSLPINNPSDMDSHQTLDSKAEGSRRPEQRLSMRPCPSPNPPPAVLRAGGMPLQNGWRHGHLTSTCTSRTTQAFDAPRLFRRLEDLSCSDVHEAQRSTAQQSKAPSAHKDWPSS